MKRQLESNAHSTFVASPRRRTAGEDVPGLRELRLDFVTVGEQRLTIVHAAL